MQNIVIRRVTFGTFLCLFFGTFLCLFLCMSVAFAQSSVSSKKWQSVSGTASDIAVGSGGAVAAINNDGVVYEFDASDQDWQRIGQSMVDIAIAPDNTIWGVDRNDNVRVYTGTTWKKIGVGAKQITLSANNNAYVVTNTKTIAQYNISTSQWTALKGNASMLAVTSDNTLWRLGLDGDVARLLDDAWIGVAGNKAKYITANGNNTVTMIAEDGRTYDWDDRDGQWALSSSLKDTIAYGANKPQKWRVNNKGKIFFQGDIKTNETIISGEKGVGTSNKAEVIDTSPIIFTAIPNQITLADLSIGFDGSIYGLTTSGDIRRWSNTQRQFYDFPGKVNRLIVQKNGLPLAISAADELIQHDGEAWRAITLNTELTDLAINKNNSVFAINNRSQSVALNDSLTNAMVLGQRGQQITLQDNKAYWVIDAQERLFFCTVNNSCERQSINATDISIGPAGSIFIVDTSDSLRRFNTSTNAFDIIRQGQTSRVAVGPGDRPWILDLQGRVLQAGYFERDEARDRNIATKTTATENITTQANNNNSTGIQIVQSITFTKVDIPTAAPGFPDLGSGMDDLTSGVDDILIATGFDFPCVDGTGRHWVYNPASRSFSYLDYLRRANLYVALAVDTLSRGVVNGTTPPKTPSPAISSLFGEWSRSCEVESRLLTYTSSVFSPASENTQNFDGAVLASPLDDSQLPDLDVAADGTIANIAPGDTLELFRPETVDTTEGFNDIDFMRVGIGKDKDDIWAVSTTYNVYQYNPSKKSFDLRSQNNDDKAKDVGVGHDGSVFIINLSKVLKKWDPASKRFVKTNKTGVNRVAVDSRGNPIVGYFPDSQSVYFGR